MTCISAPTEVQYPKLKTPKEPFRPGTDTPAAPGREGLFDHIFDHTQGRSTWKQRI